MAEDDTEYEYGDYTGYSVLGCARMPSGKIKAKEVAVTTDGTRLDTKVEGTPTDFSGTVRYHGGPDGFDFTERFTSGDLSSRDPERKAERGAAEASLNLINVCRWKNLRQPT